MFCISHRIVEYFKRNKQTCRLNTCDYSQSDTMTVITFLLKMHNKRQISWHPKNTFGNDTEYQKYIIMIFCEIDCHDLSNVLFFYVLLIRILRQ